MLREAAWSSSIDDALTDAPRPGVLRTFISNPPPLLVKGVWFKDVLTGSKGVGFAFSCKRWLGACFQHFKWGQMMVCIKLYSSSHLHKAIHIC